MVALVLSIVTVACGPAAPIMEGAPTGRVYLEPPPGWDPNVARFSPDGRHVAWYGTDSSYRPRAGLVEDGRLIPLTPRSMRTVDYAWMPSSDALLVAYNRGRTTKFATVDLDGRVTKRIIPSTRLVSDTTGMFVLNERTAVISAMTTWGRMAPTDLYSLDLTTGNVKNLTSTPNRSEMWPAPIDGARWLITGVLLSTQKGGPVGWAAIFHTTNGTQTRLTEPSHFVDVAVIAPHSTRVLFDTPFQRDRGIWETDLRGSDPRQLLPVTDVTWPAISPDGKRLLLNDVGTPGHPGGFVEFDVPAPNQRRAGI
jgi:hypothetical protein